MIRVLSIILSLFLLTGCFKSEPAPTSATEKAPEHVAIAPKTEEALKKEEPQQETNKPSGPTAQTSKQNIESTVTKPAPPPPSVTEEQVKQKYHAELSQLQGYYTGKLSGLYGQAVGDVKAGKSAKALYGQYANQAGAINEESHAKVNQVLARMKAELQANNLPISSVDQYRSVYHQEINRAKGDAMGKIRGALGL